MPRLKVEEELLGTIAACRYLRVGRSTLTSWRRKGLLRATPVEEGRRGIRYKFTRADLDEFLERIEY
jgi:excisionase family DNA binding protein